ncbi:hypothetical protein NDU88_003985 [Pleurodeles waltl]|uniref:Uncharacterized protein n=1 Tax=Pleurodeles waltl TaxID=8319 RepID=A0AAV7T6A0_PLEWA|nr:hypothetical protein NDU88_003985 [Pleurodeles waltl]
MAGLGRWRCGGRLPLSVNICEPYIATAQSILCCGPNKNTMRGDRTGRLLAHRLRVQVARRHVAELQLPDRTQTSGDEQIVAQFERF